MRWCGQSFRVSPPAVPSPAAPGPLSRDRLTARLPPSAPPVTRLAPDVSLVLAPGSPGALGTILSTLSSWPSPPLSRICSTLHEPAPAVLSAHKCSSSDTAISPRPACGSLSPPPLMTARPSPRLLLQPPTGFGPTRTVTFPLSPPFKGRIVQLHAGDYQWRRRTQQTAVRCFVEAVSDVLDPTGSGSAIDTRVRSRRGS